MRSLEVRDSATCFHRADVSDRNTRELKLLLVVPKAMELPLAVWINRPKESDTISSITVISDSEVSVL